MDKAAPILVPPLKWAGGKRWLASRGLPIPEKFERYIEPFLGSGAVFFALAPTEAILSDLNAELIDVYRAIQADPALVRRYLAQHARRHSYDYYYELRRIRTRSIFTSAARTLYLNRTCWNGLYRVNQRGEFNVPIGTKSSVLLPTDDFEKLSAALKRVKFRVSDFRPILRLAKRGDFVFVDPPYTVAHNLNGFIKYNETLFSWEDQVHLRDEVEAAAARGAKVLVTNANHKSVVALYSEFRQTILKRRGVIAAANSSRGFVEELLVQCW